MSKKTKIIVGTSMMAAGGILTYYALNDFRLFAATSGEELELVMGIGLLGAGTVFLILGLVDKNEITEGYNPLTGNGLETTFGLTPTRGGIRGSLNFRW